MREFNTFDSSHRTHFPHRPASSTCGMLGEEEKSRGFNGKGICYLSGLVCRERLVDTGRIRQAEEKERCQGKLGDKMKIALSRLDLRWMEMPYLFWLGCVCDMFKASVCCSGWDARTAISAQSEVVDAGQEDSDK